MKYILLLMLPVLSYADEQSKAIEGVKQAFLAIPEVKTLQLYTTKKVYQTVPYCEEMAVPVTLAGIELTKGKIGTKVFKTDFSVFGGTLKPESSYDLRTYEFRNAINIRWSF